MDYRQLELNIISAKDIRTVNRFSKMNVYAVVSITGDPIQNHIAKTPVHRNSGDCPTWNFPVRFTINESLAKQNRLTLFIQLFSHRSIFGDKEIGSVRIPVNELLDRAGDEKSSHNVQNMNYDVSKSSGKAKGVLNISYKFGGPFTAAPPPAVPKGDPAMAYPPESSSMPYPPPPPQHGAPYGYPPPPPYGGYPAPTQAGYGYPAQPAYRYQHVQQPVRRNNNFGMGMGAGLLGGALGGMLIGDMISDAGAYDAGYDAGFDDGGGFDF